MNYPWRFITVSFLAGLVVGALCPMLGHHRWDGRDPDKHRAHIIAKMTSELKLDETQRAQIDTLLKMTMEKRQSIYAATESQVQSMMMQSRAETRQLLRPDQQESFDRMIARLDSRRKHDGPPPHP